MSKFLSGRQAKLNLGVSAYTENKTVLQTTGKVGIGTTDAQSHSLFVVGSTNIVGHTESDTLNVSGLSTFQDNVNVGSAITMYASTGIISATQFYGDGSNLLNTGATLSAASATQRLVVTSLTSGTMVDAATDSDLTYNAATDTLNVDNLIVAGNLTVDGDQTILNVTQLEVEDINIGIASASTKLNNAQLDGAGITIHGSQGDKTLTWDNSNSRLGFNTDLYVPKVETGHAQITGGISTDGYDTGNQFELMRADGNGGWAWATVPGIFSVNNILNGFNVYEEGLVVGTAGSIHTLDFRGINVTATAAPQPNGIATVTFSTRPSFDETYITGLSTAGRLIVAGISTFNGEIDANGRIVAAATNNVIPFLYSNLGDLPSAVSFHGAFAHVHGTGKAYYAHAANWYELVNKELNGVVGTGTETYNIGNTQITGTANVGSAITMYGSTGIVSATAFYGDGSNLLNTGATLSAASGLQRLVVTDLTSGTMVDAATDGDLTFNASNNSLAVPNINVSVGATFGGTITAGSSEGVVGQYLRHVGTGVTWANFPTLRTTTTIIATNGQTVFGFTHNTNFLDVFVNGVKLSSSEYSSNGSSVTLNVGSFAGDVVELHSYNTASTYGGGGGGGGGISLTDLSVATAGSPLQLGALAYNNSNGVFTFTPPDVQGQSRQALSVGTANNPLQVGAISYNNGTGVFTYTPPDLSSYVQTNSSASFSGIDVTGHIETDTLRVSGISTFNGKTRLLDDVEFHIGTNGVSGDYKFYRDSSNTRNILYEDISGAEARFISNIGGNSNAAFHFFKGSDALARFSVNNVQLYSGGAVKFETTNTGVTVTGTVAATSFSGSGSSLTGLTGASAATYGGASVSPQITVDANGRITSITNVSIAGGGGGGGSSIIVQDSQSLVGAAGTIDFGTGLSVSAISAGVATVTASLTETDTLATVTGRGASTTNDVSVGKLTVDKGGNTVGKLDIEDKGTYSQIQFYNNNGDPKVALKGVADNLYIEGGAGIIRLHTHANFSSNGSVVLNDGGNGGTDIEGTLNVSGISTFAGNINIGHDPSTQGSGSILKANELNLTGPNSTDSNSTYYSNIRVNKVGGGFKYDLEFHSNGYSSGDIGDFIFYRRRTGSQRTERMRLSGETGNLTVTGAGSFAGILTATTFSGSGASLTNLPAANLTGTLPAISGANLTNLDATDLASGTIPDARFPATLPAVSGANLTNLPAPTPADTDVQVTFDVSSNGSSAYRITGPGYSGADDNPDIYLVRGQRYRFINGTGSSHPFRIQSDTSGTAYTDGVSGSQSGTQDFNVQHDAPARLYYQCTIHSGMIGNIYIVGGSDWRMTDVATNATPDIFTFNDVGIGTDNPNSLGKLSVVVPTTGGAGAINVQNNAQGSGLSNIVLRSLDNNGGNWAEAEFRAEGYSFKNRTTERFSITSGGHIRIPEATNTAGKLQLGASQQFSIFQDSANAYLGNDDLIISNSDVTEVLARFRNGGAVDLNHNNSTKLATTSTGISVTGNIAITNGGGIDFSATANSTNSGSMTSELLDDYEEGSWVPSFSGRSLGTAEGTYTKIGRQVLIQFNIATLNTSISAGNISINGLPFQARNINQNGAVFIGDTSGVTYSSGYGRIYGRINGAGNSMQLLQRTNDGSTHTTSPGLGTGIVLRGYAWYTTS